MLRACLGQLTPHDARVGAGAALVQNGRVYVSQGEKSQVVGGGLAVALGGSTPVTVVPCNFDACLHNMAAFCLCVVSSRGLMLCSPLERILPTVSDLVQCSGVWMWRCGVGFVVLWLISMSKELTV